MKKYNQDGLEIIGVTLTSGPPENIRAFADKWGWKERRIYKVTNCWCSIDSTMFI